MHSVLEFKIHTRFISIKINHILLFTIYTERGFLEVFFANKFVNLQNLTNWSSESVTCSMMHEIYKLGALRKHTDKKLSNLLVLYNLLSQTLLIILVKPLGLHVSLSTRYPRVT